MHQLPCTTIQEAVADQQRPLDDERVSHLSPESRWDVKVLGREHRPLDGMPEVWLGSNPQEFGPEGWEVPTQDRHIEYLCFVEPTLRYDTKHIGRGRDKSSRQNSSTVGEEVAQSTPEYLKRNLLHHQEERWPRPTEAGVYTDCPNSSTPEDDRAWSECHPPDCLPRWSCMMVRGDKSATACCWGDIQAGLLEKTRSCLSSASNHRRRGQYVVYENIKNWWEAINTKILGERCFWQTVSELNYQILHKSHCMDW